MADLALPVVPSDWSWLRFTANVEYDSPDLDTQTNYRAGSRYGLRLNYDTVSGSDLDYLINAMERAYNTPDVLTVRLREDLGYNQIPPGNATPRLTAAKTSARATQMTITTTTPIRAGFLVGIGNGVYRIHRGGSRSVVSAGTYVWNLNFPLREDIAAGTVLAHNPVFRMKGRGEPPGNDHNGVLPGVSKTPFSDGVSFVVVEQK